MTRVTRAVRRWGWMVAALALVAGTAAVVDRQESAVAAAPAAPGPAVLLPTGSTWSYRAGSPSTYPGDQWVRPDFDAGDWPRDAAPFGYHPKSAKVGIETTIGYGPDEQRKWPSYLFRRTVNVSSEQLAGRDRLRLRLKADDSAVIFINGEPAARIRYDRQQIDMRDYSRRLSQDQIHHQNIDIPLAATALRPGTNTVAVAVFQQTGSSSDTTFELGLEARVADSSDARPQQVTVSFAGDTRSRKGIAWQTLAPADTKVRYLRSQTRPDDLSDAPVASGSVEPVEGVGGYGHEVVLNGLRPDSRYWYQVGDPSSDTWSEPASFTTAGADGDVDFGWISDTQAKNADDYRAAEKTLTRLQAGDPDFVLHTGDVVDDSSSLDQWGWSLGDAWAESTTAVASGNHDAAWDAFDAHFTTSKRGNVDDPDYYSFDYDGVHVAVLDSNDIEGDRLGAAQTAWLSRDVRTARSGGARWVLVMIHKGSQSVGAHLDDVDVRGLRTQLQPLFTDLGIDLVLSGHDHVYSRSEFLDGAEPVQVTERDEGGYPTVTDPGAPLYLTANSSGTKFYPATSEQKRAEEGVHPAPIHQQNLPESAQFEIRCSVLRMKVSTYDPGTGRSWTTDSYAIRKSDVTC